jgi:hypothetical protein
MVVAELSDAGALHPGVDTSQKQVRAEGRIPHLTLMTRTQSSQNQTRYCCHWKKVDLKSQRRRGRIKADLYGRRQYKFTMPRKNISFTPVRSLDGYDRIVGYEAFRSIEKSTPNGREHDFAHALRVHRVSRVRMPFSSTCHRPQGSIAIHAGGVWCRVERLRSPTLTKRDSERPAECGFPGIYPDSEQH